MLLCVFFAVPLVYIFLLCGTSPRLLCLEKQERIYFPLAGAITAAVVCLFLALFIVAEIRHPYSFFRVLLQFAVQTAVLPFGLCALIFLAGNRQVRGRGFSVFPAVLSGFFSVFTPYMILTSYGIYPPFVSVLRPLLYCAQLIFIALFLPAFADVCQKKSRSVVFIISFSALLAAVLLLPSLACAFWTLAFPWYIWLLPVIALFAAIPGCVFLFRRTETK